GASPEIYATHVVWNDVPIQALYTAMKEVGDCEVSLDVVSGDINRLSFTAKGQPKRTDIMKVAAKTFPNLSEITRAPAPPLWSEGIDGVTQLMALVILSQRSVA